MNAPVIELTSVSNNVSDRIRVAHKQITIRSNIHFLDKIDTNKQEYLCNIRVTSIWEIYKSNEYYNDLFNSVCGIDIFESMWTPQLFFTNIIRSFKEEKWYKVEKINNKLFITENMNVLGRFSGIFTPMKF